MEEKTICAISTPLGNSAISIIRISGKKAVEIAKAFFVSKSLNYEKLNQGKCILELLNMEISKKNV